MASFSSSPITNPNPRILERVEDICFTNFHEVHTNWKLLTDRNNEAHEAILSSLNRSNLNLLDRGYSRRNEHGKLSHISFNLINEYTWNTCICCEMTADLYDSSRYRSVNPNCGKERYCPRCNFRAEQSLWSKHTHMYSSTLDFYHITFTDPSFHYFNYSNQGVLFDNFFTKLKKIHSLFTNIQAGRTRHTWLLGSLWNEEAACVNLLHDKWSSHMHVLIASPKGSVIDLSGFENIGLDILMKPVSTKSYFDNCLRYLTKPLHKTLREEYEKHYTPSNSQLLYRKVNNSIDVLRELFNKRKQGSTGIFRN